MRIHYLQHVAFEDAANIAGWARLRGHRLTHTRLDLDQPLPEPAGLDWLVVMGGPMSVVDGGPSFIEGERALIASALGARVPVLGVCFGSQLLASVLGGTVARAAEKEIGWVEVERSEGSQGDPLFDELPPRFVPFQWHEDAIGLPPGATRLARSRVTPVQAFRAASGEDVYGIQFHLESDAPMVRVMVESSALELRQDGIDAGSLLAETERHMAEQVRLAGIVFGRWAARVVARSRR